MRKQIKVYVAADFARAEDAEALAGRLEVDLGASIVSRWHRNVRGGEAAAATAIGGPKDPDIARAAAERNVSDLHAADVVVVLTTGSPTRGGRHFETGYAHALRTPIILVGPVEHAFHYLAGVDVADDDGIVERVRRLDL